MKTVNGIDMEWVYRVSIEPRQGGTRSVMLFVNPPDKTQTRYESLVKLAEEIYRGVMGEDGRVMRDADVMAWSDQERGIFTPNQYRVSANFVNKEDLDGGDEE